jgi:ElaB/YqjD/DUF883 family membrane-anchored ribosome-binding protein
MASTEVSSEGRPTEQDLEALKADLAALRDDLRSFVKHASQAAQSRAGEVRDRVVDAATQAGEKGREARDKVQTKIEDNPFMAVGIALGAGLLIGALIARRTE